MSGNDHPRQRLNNELQKLFGAYAHEHVKWEVESRGPPNNLTWYATVYIDDMNYGYGTSHTRGGAQDEAAKMACDNLRREM
ncbi:hypothetical protein BD769DRAFT_1406486 [Suillus cothurnatus]|nr:hypothetical protein BD769DRAFT_1406486 [Suillus cothurnatus]